MRRRSAASGSLDGRVWRQKWRCAAVLGMLLGAAGCDVPAAVDVASTQGVAHAVCETPDAGPPPPITDRLSPTRLLRRVHLALTGRAPDEAAYQAVLDASGEEAQFAAVQAAREALLSDPAFYDVMLGFGHDWISVGSYRTGASRESYWGSQAATLRTCGADTLHPGAWAHFGEGGGDTNKVCNDQWPDGSPREATVVTVEPWWAPGTTVTVVGRAGLDVRSHPRRDGQGTIDCGGSKGGYYDRNLPGDFQAAGDAMCGCGPNLVYCHPHGGVALNQDHDDALPKRQAWDEPARLLAHIAWHDRPLTDLVLGNYTVAPLELRHMYVRMGRINPENSALDDDDSWWNGAYTGPHDPRHPADDPLAWREVVTASLNPDLLSLSPDGTRSGALERTATYDPRTTMTQAPGLPAAGVLTSMGALSSFPRERVRAARFMEMFACHKFVPPPGSQTFGPYERDPATDGSCQHCHRALDRAAIHFKRWDFGFHYIQETPFIPGAGPWTYAESPSAARERWSKIFLPDTVMTPISEAMMTARPEAQFMDFLPPGETLFGVQSDGTYGPLGFAKMLVTSGAFDRCAVRKLHERVVGHDLDPAAEADTIRSLVDAFVAGGRQVRPFVRHLMQSDAFQRGL